MSKTTNQPHLRLAFSREEDFLEARRYAQSTSGRSVSHETFPLDSRSISIANDSPQGRNPYATLRKWPRVVRQRLAKADCSVLDGNDFRKSLSSMTADYHHVVIENATPFGAFTKRCSGGDNRPMKGKEKNELLAKVRRENLQRFIQREYGGNISELARKYAAHMQKEEARPGFFNETLKGLRGFGPALATDVEAAVDLQEGQLSIPDSPLFMKAKQTKKLSEELRAEIDQQSAAVQDEIKEAIKAVLAKHKTRRRTAK